SCRLEAQRSPIEALFPYTTLFRSVRMRSEPTVVIGAGPYGLSVAAHLRAAGIPTLTLGTPMAFWRSMPAGMFLRSAPSASSLSRSEEHTSELQSPYDLVCRLLLEK